MKTALLMISASLIAASALGDSGGVTAHLGVVSANGTHTNLMFTCNVTLDNQTGAMLTATNMFCLSPGLALRVTDMNGHQLAKMYAWPWEIWQFHIRPGNNPFSKLLYIGRYSGVRAFGVSLPPVTSKVRLQIVGTLSGSSYTNRLTSNLVDVPVPLCRPTPRRSQTDFKLYHYPKLLWNSRICC